MYNFVECVEKATLDILHYAEVYAVQTRYLRTRIGSCVSHKIMNLINNDEFSNEYKEKLANKVKFWNVSA